MYADEILAKWSKITTNYVQSFESDVAHRKIRLLFLHTCEVFIFYPIFGKLNVWNFTRAPFFSRSSHEETSEMNRFEILVTFRFCRSSAFFFIFSRLVHCCLVALGFLGWPLQFWNVFHSCYWEDTTKAKNLSTNRPKTPKEVTVWIVLYL